MLAIFGWLCLSEAHGTTVPAITDARAKLSVMEQKLSQTSTNRVEALDKSYTDAVRGLITRAQREGELATVLAAQQELKRFYANKKAPSPSPDELPDELETLIERYRQSHATIVTDYHTSLNTLLRQCSAFLEQKQRELTRAGKFTEAAAIQQERQAIEARAQALPPPEPTNTPDTGTAPDSKPDSPSYPQGLIAHYAFDGSVADSATPAHSAIEASQGKYVQGAIGQARVFRQAPDDSLSLEALLARPTWSVAFWVAFNEPRQHSSCLLAQDRAGWSGNPFWLFTSGGRIAVIFNRQDLRYRSGSKPHREFAKSTELEAKRQYHVVCTYTERDIKVYINGKEDAHYTGLMHPSKGITRPLTVGGLTRTQPSYPLNGWMDDLCFFDRALSPLAVQRLYNGRGKQTVGGRT